MPELRPVVVKPKPHAAPEHCRRHEKGDEREREKVFTDRLSSDQGNGDADAEREPHEREQE